MAKVAFLTSALLKAPVNEPLVQGFIDRAGAVLAVADAGLGFLDQVDGNDPNWTAIWGEWAVPTVFRKEEYALRVAQTLSLWRDLDSVFAFAYNGLHAEALSKRREWFIAGEWPAYVAWWVADDHIPSLQEACDRFDQLHQAGTSPQAFDFKNPFDEDGRPVQLNRQAIKQLAEHYRR